MKQNCSMKDFTKQYEVQKTIKWALNPIGKTEEFMEQMRYQEAARRKDSSYLVVKPIIDQKIKVMIGNVLDDCEPYDWNSLEEAVINYQKDKSEKNKTDLNNKQQAIRKKIAKNFEDSKEYKIIFKEGLFKKILPQYLDEINASEDKKEAVKEFENFKTYFERFLNLRKDIFKAEEKQNMLPYRIVNENFMIFVANKKNHENLLQLLPNAETDIIALAKERNSWEEEKYLNISRWFETDVFQKCMSQNGLEIYNTIIGFVNLYVNQYIQQHPENNELKRNKLKMRVLKKQILSDRTTPTWLPEQFSEGEEGEKEIFNAIKAFEDNFIANRFEEHLKNLLKEVDTHSKEIYISNKDLTKVSIGMALGWDYLSKRTSLFEKN